MNFDLDDDLRALRDGIRDLCEGSLTLERARRHERDGLDRGTWTELAESGVFALRLADHQGGLGLGVPAATVVIEQLGRVPVPGPIVPTHVAAADVPGASTGEAAVGLVERAAPAVVDHLADLDALVVLDDAGAWVVPRADLEGRPVEHPLDPLTPVYVVDRLPQGERLGGPDLAARWGLEGAALTAAFLVGIAGATTDRAVAYAKEREQFGRTIGSFQAIKHLLADMHVRTELARAAVHAAAVVLDDPDSGHAATAVAGAKLLAGQAAVANAKGCVQVMGGMGFTWEVAAHLYLKRAVVLETAFGSSAVHEERVAASL